MSANGRDRATLERFREAHLRGAEVDELLELADRAIDEAVGRGDPVAVRRAVLEVDSVATLRGAEGRGLGIAAARARAALQPLPAAAQPPPAAAQPATAPPAVPAGPEPANWDRRVAAFIVDWLLLAVVIDFGLSDSSSDAAVFAMVVLVPLLYFALLQWLFARTLGKLLVGTAVRREDGDQVGLAASFIRTVVQALLAVTVVGFFVDFLVLVSSPRRQALHDRAAGTVVIRVRKAPRDSGPHISRA